MTNTNATTGKKSRYAEKRSSGNQMYGPGCCAHKVSDVQIANARKRAMERRMKESMTEGQLRSKAPWGKAPWEWEDQVEGD